MTDKSNFTPDEWKLLLQSVVAAGIAVTAADPSGLWGLLKESFAGGTDLAKAKMDPGTNALIKAVVADFSTAEGSAARDGLKNTFKGSKPAEIKDKCIEILRQTAAIVDVKAPGDAAALKGWLQQISQHVAEAAKESGFLGIGGVPVSDAEKATLTEISSALKLAAYTRLGRRPSEREQMNKLFALMAAAFSLSAAASQAMSAQSDQTQDSLVVPAAGGR